MPHHDSFHGVEPSEPLVSTFQGEQTVCAVQPVGRESNHPPSAYSTHIQYSLGPFPYVSLVSFIKSPVLKQQPPWWLGLLAALRGSSSSCKAATQGTSFSWTALLPYRTAITVSVSLAPSTNYWGGIRYRYPLSERFFTYSLISLSKSLRYGVVALLNRAVDLELSSWV